MPDNPDTLTYALAEELVADGLVDIVVAPDGLTQSKKGSFLVDDEAWELIRAAFDARKGVDLVFDFDHTTLGGPWVRRPDGLSVAAGWIKSLRYEKGRGIIASVEWTEKARKAIRAKTYKYPSGVYDIDKKTKRVTEIISVAATNTPATPGAEALAASTHEGVTKEIDAMPKNKAKKTLRERLMVLQEAAPEEVAAVADEVVEEVDEIALAIAELKAAMGLGEEVSAVDVVKAATEKMAAPAEGEGEGEGDTAETEALSALKVRAGLEKGATVMALSRKFDALHTERVSGEDYKAMSERVEVLEADKSASARDALVEKYIDGGKLNPHDEKQMTWARQSALDDPKGFVVLMAGASQVHPVGETITADGSGPKDERQKLIASASKEWQDSPRLRAGASEKSYVLAALSIEDMDALTEAETKTLIA